MANVTKNFLSEISKHVNILANISLILIDDDFEKLRSILLRTKKETFQHNDYYVICHGDTDFYLPGSPYGLSIFNLVRTFQEVDISLGRVIFVTDHLGIEEEFKFLIPQKLHQFDLPLIIDNCMSASSDLMLDNFCYPDINVNPAKIKKHALCMMGAKRIHRNGLFHFLKNNNLLEKIVTSYNNT